MILNEEMLKEDSQTGVLVLAVVRGDLPVDAVRRIGIDIDEENGFYRLKSGNLDVTVTPTASDVAQGILRYGSVNKNDVRKWAFFLLAESGALDFSGLESHPQGEELISALWDASFEGHVSNETIELARRLTMTAIDDGQRR
jgi:hypothetical protein